MANVLKSIREVAAQCTLQTTERAKYRQILPAVIDFLNRQTLQTHSPDGSTVYFADRSTGIRLISVVKCTKLENYYR